MSNDADAVARAEGGNRPPSPSTGKKRWGVVVVVILGLTALATAWSGYQASLWDGIQSSNTQASAARTSAAQQRSAANQFRIADLTVFESDIDALISGNAEIADFYRPRFRDEFAVAYQAWLALDPLENPEAPPAPFEMPEYRLAADQTARDLEARADALFADGENANDYSDTYTLTTLLFAVVLFFAVIAERFEYVRTRVALLVLAGIGLVSGVAVALGQPITSG